ncbi:MAG: hypothetical protein KatS3mg097_573 [Candidatus Parcubacteria bacterium]|nr:MAG: hypothetical protein KatS3mg097_573 [Candidatus Parcubacteria bacterium]
MNIGKSKEVVGIKREIEKRTFRRLETTREEEIVERFLKEARKIFQELRTTEEGKANEKIIYNLANKLNISRKKLRKIFEYEFKHVLRIAFEKKYLNRIIPPRKQKEALKKIIEAFVLVFRSILKQLNKERIKGKLLTEEMPIKRKIREYSLNPKIIKKLKQEFPQAPLHVIKYAVFYNPDNPQEFINNFLERIKILKEKFKDIPTIFLEPVILYHPDKSEDFIKDLLTRVKEVLDKLFRETKDTPK